MEVLVMTNLEVKIKCNSKEEAWEVGGKIHDQLTGNQDYIDSNIVLHVDEDENTVELYFDELKSERPEIKI